MSDDDPRWDTDLSRRALLRRGAVVGAVAWTAPVVRTLPAAGATGSPPPDDPGRDISYVAIVVNCSGTAYRIKYEDDSGWEDDPGASTGTGCAPDGWASAEPISGADLGVTVVEIEPSRWQVVIPHSCGDAPVTDGRAKAAGGKNLECVGPISQGWTSQGFELVFDL